MQFYDTEEEKPTQYHINVKDMPQLGTMGTGIDGTSREYTLTDLQPGKAYQVIITAENSGGSVESDELSLQTLGKSKHMIV